MQTATHKLKVLTGYCFLFLLFFDSLLQAETVTYNQVSDPPGFINSTSDEETSTSISTVAASLLNSGYKFTHWTTNTSGVVYRDITGRAFNQLSFTIFEITTATAHYMDKDIDTDADLVPDWFEIHFYDNLSNVAASDTDADGYTMLEEYIQDTHPNLPNQIIQGGNSHSSSHSVDRTNLSFFIFDEVNYVFYKAYSNPPGFIPLYTEIVLKGTAVTTPGLLMNAAGWRFTHWENNGVRLEDIVGRGLPAYTNLINVHTDMVAHYIKDGVDSDADLVPDWFEVHFHADISNAASSDLDGDGYTLIQEYNYDFHPGIFNQIIDGGDSRSSSDLFTYDISGLLEFSVSSNPPGFVIANTVYESSGTNVSSPSLHGVGSGWYFTYWEIGGVRQTDFIGISLAQLDFSLTQDTIAVANYVDKDDETDGDGIPDWFELHYYGTLANGPSYDSDGDGYTLLQEYTQDFNPLIFNKVINGGNSRASSDALYLDFQIFERLRFTRIDGTINEIFTFDPSGPPVWPLAADASVAFVDWDGDNDPDIFMADSAGLRVFENIGTQFNPQFTEKTANFVGLSGLISILSEVVITAGDFNDDGNADFGIGGATGSVFLFDSSGHFNAGQPSVPAVTVVTGSTQTLPAFGDMNGDGKDDLLVMLSDGTVNLYTHSGGSPEYSAFAADILNAPVTNAASLAVADTDGDGDLDVVASDADGRIWKFLNSGGVYILNSKVWGGTGNGFAQGMVISTADYDGDGDSDIIGGTDSGVLFALRDPKLGPPVGLYAEPGADSVLLIWAPDRQSRVKGYHVYRSSPDISGPFTKLTANHIPLPEYLDNNVTASTAYHYYVTAITETYLPGNNVPRLVESLPSDIVSIVPGSIDVTLPCQKGQAGTQLEVPIVISNTQNISGNMQIVITYDNSILTPIDVLNNELSDTVTFTHDGASNSGTWTIDGSGGALLAGSGPIMTLVIDIAAGTPLGTFIPLNFISVTFEDLSAQAVSANALNDGITVSNIYFPGDVNGDGLLDNADKAHMQWLFRGNTRDPNADELCAGDLNGDGRITGRDLALLLRLIAGKPITK